jgi:3-methyl-2-oxobutanoate hydroxymethyltransferase
MYADNTPPSTPRAAITVPKLRQMKAEGERIASLTAYDASFARAVDAAGMDAVLVGDSLGMVVQGHHSTLPVTVEDIVYHCACVARGLRKALLIADMPFQSYATPDRAIAAATAMLGRGGAGMVKLEGAGALLESIRFLAERDIPVCAHLGLTPQSVLKLGGYKVQGREETAAKRLLADAQAVAEAGADLLVLECVPSALAAEITRNLAIPTIGIGAGAGCDGQILVLHDLLGLNSGHRRPRFVKDFLAQGGSIDGALKAYVQAVKQGEFPSAEHSYDA